MDAKLCACSERQIKTACISCEFLGQLLALTKHWHLTAHWLLTRQNLSVFPFHQFCPEWKAKWVLTLKTLALIVRCK